MRPPRSPLTVICHHEVDSGDEVGICAGFERGQWRQSALVDSVMEWLPEFALSHTEVESIDASNAVRMTKRAAAAVYKTEKYGLRGEFGEILLHIILRKVFGTIPAVSKIYYKSSINKTVEGFDAVHIVSSNEGIELWIGETKFYKSLSKAIRDVCDEIAAHLETDYLRDEFLLIRNKVDPNWPHADRIKELINEDTSLDEIFSCAAIPVLLTYDSKAVKAYNNDMNEYKKRVKEEFVAGWNSFRNRLGDAYTDAFDAPLDIKVHVILMPLESKSSLQTALNKRLKELQG